MSHLKPWLACVALVALNLTLAPPAPAAGPELVSVEKIWDRGAHNAFTDLIRWHDRWYCTFREADAHVGGDGALRVLESADGRTWRPAGLITEAGGGLRAPKLSITPHAPPMIVARGGGLRGGGKPQRGRAPPPGASER